MIPRFIHNWVGFRGIGTGGLSTGSHKPMILWLNQISNWSFQTFFSMSFNLELLQVLPFPSNWANPSLGQNGHIAPHTHSINYQWETCRYMPTSSKYNLWEWLDWLSYRYSSCGSVCDPAKEVSCPSLVVYFFVTQPIELKLGQQIGGAEIIANHLRQSLWWANQKHWASVRFYLIHSLWHVYSVDMPFPSHCKLWKCTEPKPLSWAKPAYFDTFPSTFTVQITFWAQLEMLLGPLFSGGCHPWLHKGSLPLLQNK
jgi:hypothetical protein